jgi:hypothetical protein
MLLVIKLRTLVLLEANDRATARNGLKNRIVSSKSNVKTETVQKGILRKAADGTLVFRLFLTTNTA